MSKLIIVPIEKIETRYSVHWYKYVPEFMKKNTKFDEVIQIDSELVAPSNTSGGFFNFNFTCEYKASQVSIISDLIKSGRISDGDVIFYTDYWNPTVHMVRYMLDLNGIRCKIVGIAHAGDWDPADILNQKLVDKTWSRATEMSLHAAYDEIYFATEFSRHLYSKSLELDSLQWLS